jgi:HPt (histidine-containing phosphotransfer) domain-containing protein
MDNEQGDAIDRAVLEELRSLQSEGEPDLVKELFDSFCEEVPTLITAMREAVKNGAPDKLRQAAHSLKGSSGGLGAKPLAAVCAEVEKVGRAGSVEGVADKIDRVEHEYARVLKALETEVK